TRSRSGSAATAVRPSASTRSVPPLTAGGGTASVAAVVGLGRKMGPRPGTIEKLPAAPPVLPHATEPDAPPRDVIAVPAAPPRPPGDPPTLPATPVMTPASTVTGPPPIPLVVVAPPVPTAGAEPPVPAPERSRPGRPLTQPVNGSPRANAAAPTSAPSVTPSRTLKTFMPLRLPSTPRGRS